MSKLRQPGMIEMPMYRCSEHAKACTCELQVKCQSRNLRCALKARALAYKEARRRYSDTGK